MTDDVEIALQVEDRVVFRASLTLHPHAFDLLLDYIKKYDGVRNKMIHIGNATNGMMVEERLSLPILWEESSRVNAPSSL